MKSGGKVTRFFLTFVVLKNIFRFKFYGKKFVLLHPFFNRYAEKGD